MKEFGLLLKNVFNSLNRDNLERESILFALKNTTGITLTSSNIFIKDGVLEITANPTIKNEIKIKEERILDNLKKDHNLSYRRVLYK